MGTAAGGTNDGAGAGTGAGAGGNGAGGSGTPDAASGASGAAGSATGIDRTKLSPVLQNLNEDQINEVFDTMFGALRNANSGRDLSGVPAHAREPEKPAAPTRESLEKAYKEMMDPNSDNYNPMKAMEDMFARTVAPVLGAVNGRAVAGMMTAFRNNPDYPGFNELERDITTALSKKNPGELTESDVVGTYLVLVGAKEVEKRKQETKRPATTHAPSPEASGPPKKTSVEQLSDVELTVARTMYRGAKSDEDAATKYLEDLKLEGIGMKVPVGGGKTE